MRTLFLLRGAPGSGKSTWVNRNNLEPYTLCADQIRTLIQCPVLNLNGTFSISQKNDKEVWEYLFHLLETRMARGEMLIIDATHYKKELLNKYKKLVKKYRYRVYVLILFQAYPWKNACVEIKIARVTRLCLTM